MIAALNGAGQTGPREPHNFLENHIDFKEADFQAMERGQAIAKILKTDQKTEVAVFGIVWVNAPIESFVKWQKDIERFESGDAVLAIKKISSPPAPEDFESLTFPEEDLNALPKCKPGKCDVKIGEKSLEQLQEFDWSAPGAHDHANRVIQGMLLEYTGEYVRNGDTSLAALRDKKRPMFIEKELDGLLENSPYLIEYIPELNRYLDDYPKAKPEGAEEFLYWSKVKFGLKPTVRLNHVVICPFSREGGTSVAIASKMLYASHYFHTALELKVLVRDSAKPNAEGFYLISLNRSRSDGLTGLFGGIVRSKAESEAQKGMIAALDSGRDVLEAASRRTSSQSSRR
jgi:hypothetical protein